MVKRSSFQFGFTLIYLVFIGTFMPIQLFVVLVFCINSPQRINLRTTVRTGQCADQFVTVPWNFANIVKEQLWKRDLKFTRNLSWPNISYNFRKSYFSKRSYFGCRGKRQRNRALVELHFCSSHNRIAPHACLRTIITVPAKDIMPATEMCQI